MRSPYLHRRKEPGSIFLALFLFIGIILSPNGHNIIQASPKTFLEGLLIVTGALLVLIFTWRHPYKVVTQDLLLLAPIGAFAILAATGDVHTSASVLHPALILTGAFCVVSVCRDQNREKLQNFLFLLAMAISATGVSWLTLPNDPISLITQYQSIAAWGYETEEPLRFPLFVINPFGGFAQKNIFSVLLATACLISLYVGYQLTRPAKSALFFIVCAACLLTSYVIGLLGTLTAILGLTCGIIFLAFDRFLRKAWDLRSVSLFLIVITGLLIGDWDPFDFSVYDHATAKISTESRSIICRLTWWEFNLKQLLDNPLFGSGLDSFSGLFMEYAYQKPEVLENCEATPSHSHNLILHLIGETGLFGLIFIAGPVAIWFIKCLRRNTFFVVLALLSPIAFHTNTEWPLHTSMLTWFIMLTIPIAFGPRSDDTSRTKFSGKFIIATGLMVCALYGAVTTAAHRAVSLERYIIQRSTAPKQIELLIKSKYRTHPAFRPIYEIAINRALLDIAIHQKDYDLIKRSLIDYRKSIGPIAGHSEINRIYKARQVLSDLSQ